MGLHEQIGRGYDWFLSQMHPQEWSERKRKIQEHLLHIRKPHSTPIGSQAFKSVSALHDRFGWYLYLAETFLHARNSYEPIQGARVMAVFAQLGDDTDLLNSIVGISEKRRQIISGECQNTDGGFFEILTALMYARNGWQTVELLPNSPVTKTPDIHLQSPSSEWFVECKRLVGWSTYSTEERQKWLRMWQPLCAVLFENRTPFIFEIVFHVELKSLPDDFLLSQLIDKLPLLNPPARIIENETLTIDVRFLDLDRVQKHFSKYFVKEPSDQLQELIIGRRVRQGGTTTAYYGSGGTLGSPTGTNRVVESIEYATGAVWDCDAQRSIEIKARDIRSHLSDAVEQLPASAPSAVHIGLETLDGWPIERERFERICRTVLPFDNNGKPLHWIYCHLFQPYSPPEVDWEFDETIYYFHSDSDSGPPPAEKHSLIVPYENVKDGTHWH